MKHAPLRLMVFLAYSLLAVVMTYPLVCHLDTAVNDYGDPLLNSWILAWDAHALTTDPSGLFNANIYYPHALTLAYSEHMLANALIGLPLFTLGANGILVHNVLLLLSFALSGFGVFLLVRHLTGNGSAGFVAGMLFAFCPFRFEHLAHLQIISCQWLPFIFLFTHRFFETQHKRDLLLAALFFVIQMLTCLYIGMFAAIAMGLLFLYGMLSIKSLRQPPALARIALTAALASLLLLPFAIPYFRVKAQMGFSRDLNEVKYYSARIENYVAFPRCNRVFGQLTAAAHRPEGALYPGSLAVLGAAFLAASAMVKRKRSTRPLEAFPHPALAATRRALLAFAAISASIALAILIFGDLSFSIGPVKVGLSGLGNPFRLALLFSALALLCRPSALGRSLRDLAAGAREYRPVLFYSVLALLAFALSLGPEVRCGERFLFGGLYGLLYDHLPGFKAIRVPARFAVLVALSLAVLAGYAAHLVSLHLRHRLTGACLLATAVLLVCAENWCVPKRYFHVAPEPPAHYRWLADQPGDFAVIETPMYSATTPHNEAHYVYASTHHWKRLVNGYSGFAPPATAPIEIVMRAFPSHESINLLRRLEVRYVVHHTPHIRDTLIILSEFADALRVVYQSNEVVISEILAGPETPTLPPGGQVIPAERMVASATLNNTAAGLALDGDPVTRWMTLQAAPAGCAFQIQLDKICSVSGIELLTGEAYRTDFPVRPVIETSLDAKTWSPAAVDGFPMADYALDCVRNPIDPVMRFHLGAPPTRHLRIRLAEPHPVYWWSLSEIRVYEVVPQ